MATVTGSYSFTDNGSTIVSNPSYSYSFNWEQGYAGSTDLIYSTNTFTFGTHTIGINLSLNPSYSQSTNSWRVSINKRKYKGNTSVSNVIILNTTKSGVSLNWNTSCDIDTSLSEFSNCDKIEVSARAEYTTAAGTHSSTRYYVLLKYTFILPDSYNKTLTLGNITAETTPISGLLIAGYSTASVIGTVGGDMTVNIDTITATCTGTTATATKNSETSISYLSGLLQENENDYAITLNSTITDMRGRSVSAYTSATVLGYSSPTVTADIIRCDQDGTLNALGVYAKVTCTLSFTSLNNQNSIQTIKLYCNNEEKTMTGGSIASGTCIYLFPIGTDTQGNLEIQITDLLKTNTITGYIVPKAVMAFSLYSNGTTQGACFGRMATQDGLWVYMDFYLKASNGNVWKIDVDSNGNIITTLQA